MTLRNIRRLTEDYRCLQGLSVSRSEERKQFETMAIDHAWRKYRNEGEQPETIDDITHYETWHEANRRSKELFERSGLLGELIALEDLQNAIEKTLISEFRDSSVIDVRRPDGILPKDFRDMLIEDIIQHVLDSDD